MKVSKPFRKRAKRNVPINRVKKSSRPYAIENIAPKEINARETVGHWEMDCVEGKKKTKKTLLALTERQSRFVNICKLILTF